MSANRRFAKEHEPFAFTVGDDPPPYLTRLRGNGVGRWSRYACAKELDKKPIQYYDFCSHPFQWLWLGQGPRKGIYLDLACGMSGDVIGAASLGYESFGLDVFPMEYPRGLYEYKCFDELTSRFMLADIGVHIPFDDNSVFAASSSAAIDLLSPEKRLRCYQEALRVLQPGSIFALAGLSLANGWGWDRRIELERALSVGFELVFNAQCGFKLKKPEVTK